jgi:hypothetical protein
MSEEIEKMKEVLYKPTPHLDRKTLEEIDEYFHYYDELLFMVYPDKTEEEIISMMFVKFFKDRGESNETIRKKLEEFKASELWKAYTFRKRGKSSHQ